MIRFRTTIERNPDVPAWDVQVRALYVDAPVLGGPFSAAFDEAERLSSLQNGHEGIVIATLEAMIADSPRVNRRSAVSNMIERHLGVGGTFDTCPNATETAEALLGWVRNGGDEAIFRKDKTHLRRLVVTKFLDTDPYVDRGGVLAHMIPHLAAFSPDRLIVAHQECVERALPPDQRGRIRERFRAVAGICERFGYEVVGAEMGAEARGACRDAKAPAGEELAVPGDLPLIIISVPGTGNVNPRYNVWEGGEIEILDLADWGQARLCSVPAMSRP